MTTTTNQPPSDNMGVENAKSWHIDYLTVTIWGSKVVEDFGDIFYGTFPEPTNLGHGGRFYRDTFATEPGIMLRTNPISQNGEERTTIEIPGTACQLLGFQRLADFLQYLYRLYERVKINRIDLAFDNCGFEPEDFFNAIRNERVRSYVKRDTVKFYSMPYQKDEKGKEGTSGLTFGSRSSERYMRIYNKHGYTRLEVEFKGDYADQVGCDVLLAGTVDNALRLSMGYLLDFVDVQDEWWLLFKEDYERLFARLGKTVPEYTMEKIKKWFEGQVKSAFYVIATLEDSEYLDSLYKLGREKVGKSKYGPMMRMVGAV